MIKLGPRFFQHPFRVFLSSLHIISRDPFFCLPLGLASSCSSSSKAPLSLLFPLFLSHTFCSDHISTLYVNNYFYIYFISFSMSCIIFSCFNHLLVVTFILCWFFAVSRAAQSCFSDQKNATAGFVCPPFTSTPPFPFSSSPGCGHPSFQVKCSSSSSNAVISINNLNFSLLHYEPNSTSLTLSPQPAKSPNACSSLHLLALPDRSINFSGSPFRVSDASCSRLSVLRSCSPLNLPNCSHCPFECKLVKNPATLVHDCESTHRFDLSSEQGCQNDILDFLDNFLESEGIQVEYDEAQDSYFSSCKSCQAQKGVCGFNSSHPNKPFICFHSKSSLSPPWIHETNRNRISIISIILALTCLLFAFSVGIAIFWSRQFKSATEEDPTTLFLHRHRSASLLPPVFTFEELEFSTNKFDAKRKIGDGGFGSVYLGQLFDGRIVAVKYLHCKQRNTPSCTKAFSTKSFCNEILILSSINHPNLIKLHGYCSDPRGLLLVYEYITNGTLADHLHGSNSLHRKGSLTWQVRLDIALQTALALEYLHFSVVPPIVHRDITTSNIFVEKDMRIKVGDFGLSRLMVLPDTTSSSSSGFVCTGPQGTPGYLDPDYHRSFRLTEKSDVYSFGVVLLELISGLKAVDQTRDKREVALADLVVSKIQLGMLHQVVDPALVDDEEAVDGVDAVAELAFRCVAADKDDRPDAKEIVEELKRIGNSRDVSNVSDVSRQK
ncbi:LEAF RUST 10 DISEASE-RESISTANCE LOCUS RECEPTOR-LIKE PROTEIN KINASE-like 1.5 [Mangifera indica]|uniref:LEAF RUST 10 DISEASE-RESISTANCE LOCUS RECEPTOR-LIKE PROTEIN KINASE-like 1.5 n=1 Tax=Mangifera indica TaxID=29780 RepID=UPI001CFBD2A0|nr:LEAF RUST 10 DISEASE-RESISTANCE LOCUS RECEPTOR-LIKE PROTEIN KINASE-like 1.5 [Mangifera indica]